MDKRALTLALDARRRARESGRAAEAAVSAELIALREELKRAEQSVRAAALEQINRALAEIPAPAKGADGRPGDAGAPGKAGQDGHGIASAKIVDGRLVLVRDDGKELDAGPFPRGKSGEIFVPRGMTEERVLALIAANPSATAWGAITGTLANQTDLQTALNGKEATGVAAAGDAAHVAAGDPHPQYLTAAEGNAAYEVVGAVATHAAAADPHTGYQKESEKGVAGGYASLDGGGTVPDAQIPAAIARDAEVTAAVSASEAGQVRDGDAASGDLGGTYPSPTVTQTRGLRETTGPTTLVVGAVADGEFLKRVGATVVGASPAGSAPAYTALVQNLGAARNSGTFDITGLSGLTANKFVDIVQSAAAVASKGNARDEGQMDMVQATGYVVDATTIRVSWWAPGVIVGDVAFAYAVTG